ncbi:hypothetical protein YC2023_016347 [Brassica napus]
MRSDSDEEKEPERSSMALKIRVRLDELETGYLELLVINPIHVELDIKFLDLGETKAYFVAVSPFAAILASSLANIMYDVGYISHHPDNLEKLDEKINGYSWNVGRASFLPSGVLFSNIGICGQKLQYRWTSFAHVASLYNLSRISI